MQSWFPLLVGLFVGGAAIGLVGFALVRRRRTAMHMPLPLRASVLTPGADGLGRVPQEPVAVEVPAASQPMSREAGTCIEWMAGTRRLGTVTRYEDAPHLRREAVALDAKLRDGVEALLHGAPALAIAAQSGLGNMYTLRFGAETMKGLADGSLSMMRSVEGGIRGNVVNAKGTIVAQASLDAVSKAGVAAMAVWQVLAIVAAQKFLADINQKLASIERGIADLKAWLEEERLGRLQGNLAYLRQMAEAAQKGGLTETDIVALATQLEAIERESQHVMASVEMPLDAAFAQVKTMVLTGRGLKEHSRAAQEAVHTFSRRGREFHLAAYVRGAAIQVRAALPLARDVARVRAQELGTDLRRQSERQRAFLETARYRVSELRGAWSWDSTDIEHQQALQRLLLDSESALSDDARLLSEATSRLNLLLQMEGEGDARPLELVATLDGAGQVLRLERVTME